MKRSEITGWLHQPDGTSFAIEKTNPTVKLVDANHKEYRVLSVYLSDNKNCIYIDIERKK